MTNTIFNIVFISNFLQFTETGIFYYELEINDIKMHIWYDGLKPYNQAI